MLNKETGSKEVDLNVEAIIDICRVILGRNPMNNLKTRKRPIVEARFITMYFIKKYSMLGLVDIGRLFHDKDVKKKHHATVLHACKTVENLLTYDERIIDYVTRIDRNIKTAIPYIKENHKGSIVKELKTVKDFNIKLINRAIFLKDKIDRMPDNIKKQYFGNDQYFYPTKQKDSGVGMVYES